MILAITLATTGAAAQQYRPDAEGYPCTAKDRLTITQDDQGYSIRSRPVAAPLTKEAPVITIGSGLRVDARIFGLIDQANAEVSHAPRR
ncbi:MAG: hypothetical protein CVT77_07760 [Alphaproteobacteria bacterium HGW-Alphaproteobacteria-16]|nr:MAG: hypothetical protein CVT77_07760 [Alphaproteobacteria bacterium HGW-Alphaproteobacteria-16]